MHFQPTLIFRLKINIFWRFSVDNNLCLVSIHKMARFIDIILKYTSENKCTDNLYTLFCQNNIFTPQFRNTFMWALFGKWYNRACYNKYQRNNKVSLLCFMTNMTNLLHTWFLLFQGYKQGTSIVKMRKAGHFSISIYDSDTVPFYPMFSQNGPIDGYITYDNYF